MFAFESVAAAVVAQQADDIQEDVDEVQVQGQSTVDGSFLRQLRVACIVGIHLLELLGVIGGQEHEQHQTNAAVEHRAAKAEAEQHPDQAGNDQGYQTHHQARDPIR